MIEKFLQIVSTIVRDACISCQIFWIYFYSVPLPLILENCDPAKCLKWKTQTHSACAWCATRTPSAPISCFRIRFLSGINVSFLRIASDRSLLIVSLNRHTNYTVNNSCIILNKIDRNKSTTFTYPHCYNFLLRLYVPRITINKKRNKLSGKVIGGWKLFDGMILGGSKAFSLREFR